MKRSVFLLMAFFAIISINAQQLLTPTFTYSQKKTAYLTLKDGTEMIGVLKDLNRKKGLIERVKFEDGDGKVHKLKPEDISFMYLPPSGLDNLSKVVDALTNVQKWNDEKLNQDLLNKGYIYIENAQVKIKKKEYTMLMQLLNPTFSKEVKVYHDPKAKKTKSLGVGGINLAGGNAKSYYVQKGDNAAFKLEKKNYNKEFKPLWGSCQAVVENNPSIKWNELTKHLLEFSECGE
jgi:hypothetical protein